MEFLVHVTLAVPATVPLSQQQDLRARELARAAELRASGTLVRVWRDPGRTANWSLYSVADATELHEALSSLPLFAWMDIDVHALAAHPAEISDGAAGTS